MGRERQLLNSNRVLKVAEGASAVTSVSSGVAGALTESPALAVIGLGAMFLTIGIEILRQKIKRITQLEVRRRKR